MDHNFSNKDVEGQSRCLIHSGYSLTHGALVTSIIIAKAGETVTFPTRACILFRNFLFC